MLGKICIYMYEYRVFLRLRVFCSTNTQAELMAQINVSSEKRTVFWFQLLDSVVFLTLDG